MSPLPFRAGKVVLRGQAAIEARISRTDGIEPSVRWAMAVLIAPEEVDTDVPVAVLTDLRVQTEDSVMRASHMAYVELPEHVDRATLHVDDLRPVIVRLFGGVLWYTAVTAVRQLAAIGEVGTFTIPADAPEPLDLQVEVQQ